MMRKLYRNFYPPTGFYQLVENFPFFLQVEEVILITLFQSFLVFVLKGQKLSIPLKWYPEAGNMQRDLISDHRFYMVTDLGQIISFDPFWAP